MAVTKGVRPKKVPMRQCMGCGEKKEKKDLIRIIRTPDEEIVLDVTGKKNGRGAYLCDSISCLSKARKKKAIDRALNMTIPEDVSIKSQLYKNVEENVYYLTIEKGRLSMKDLEQYCACATEFSELVTKEQSYIQYCKEHYKCIIKKGAIKVLRELAI